MSLYSKTKGRNIMVQLSNSTAITLAPGATASFDKASINNGGCTCYRNLSPGVKMTSRGTYLIMFSGNISGAAAGTPVQLAFSIGGTAVPQSTMISTPAAANDVNNVSKQLYYPNCCDDFDRVSVVNNGTVDVTIAPNATFSVKKVGS